MTNEEFPPNLNGDGEIHGSFKLTKINIQKFLDLDTLISCPGKEVCKVSTFDREDHSQTASSDDEKLYTIVIDKDTNTVDWSVMFY